MAAFDYQRHWLQPKGDSIRKYYQYHQINSTLYLYENLVDAWLSVYLTTLAMHSPAAASRPRLSETDPKLFVFETSCYAFSVRYCIESVALQNKREYS